MTWWMYNLPKFRLKCFSWHQGESESSAKQTLLFIAIHAVLRISVIGGQRSVRIAPPSLTPHHTSPATKDFQSSISVEVRIASLSLPPHDGEVSCSGAYMDNYHPIHWKETTVLDHGRGKELLVKEALHIQMTPLEEHRHLTSNDVYVIFSCTWL